MAIFKRVSCPQCTGCVELRNGKERLKSYTCPRCNHSYAVNTDNSAYYIDYCLPNGKRRREKIGPDRKLAETVLYKRKVEIAEGKHLDIDKKENVNFEEFSNEYLQVHSKQHKRSWKTDFHIIKILNRFFKGRYLYEITPQDIEHFKIERSKETVGSKKTGNLRNISNATINRELDVLSVIFSKAVVWGKMKINPMKSVASLKVTPGRLRFLEKEEIDKLLLNCNGNLKAIVVLAIYTGMRKSEIFGLRWHDVDFKRNIITLLKTKNGEKREIDMVEEVKNTLIGVRKHPNFAYIFCDDQGNQVRDITKSFSTALENSGIKYGSPDGVTLHTLRHTFGSQLAMSGVDLNTIRELMGHKDMAMTLRYSHLSRSHKQQAVETLAKRLRIDTGLTPDKKVITPETSGLSQVIIL